MATAVKEKDLTVEEKLIALYELQKIHTHMDQIHRLKGELPMEVKDLEDEITGLETRLQNQDEAFKKFEVDLQVKKGSIKDSESLIAKYEKQQNNVKNNREFDALSKEIELQKLEIQLAEKKIKDAKEDAKNFKEGMKETEEMIDHKQKDLKAKKKELSKIGEETDIEEEKMLKQAHKAEKNIEERLLNAYSRTRKNYKNGLAVVKIERDSCGGCFAQIPPQRQSEIAQRKKVIVCEHCGRILVDQEIDK